MKDFLDLDYSDEFKPIEPYKVDINGVEWKIHEVCGSTVLSDNVALAACNVVDKAIYLSQEFDQDFKKVALLHELAHAFVFSYLLERTNNFNEEELCHFVAKYSPQINKLADDYFKNSDCEIKENFEVGIPKPKIPTASCPKANCPKPTI